MSPGTALLSALQEGSFASAMRDSIWLYPLIVPTGTLMFASDLVCEVNAHPVGPKLYLAIIQRCNPAAIAAPMNCAAMNAGASVGRMPEKVSVNERARVTAGLANDVDAVNQ